MLPVWNINCNNSLFIGCKLILYVFCDGSIYVYDTVSCLSIQPVLHDWYNKGHGMCYPVCGMVHISFIVHPLSYFSSQPVLNDWYKKIVVMSIRHKVKNHSDNERGNLLLPPHGLLFSISSNIS